MPTEPPSPSRAELARELLRYKMEDYSEGTRCASWLVDLEFDLWNAAEIKNPSDRQKFEVSLSKKLRILAEIAGGWWVFEDETVPSKERPVFVSMERWLQILATRIPKSAS